MASRKARAGDYLLVHPWIDLPTAVFVTVAMALVADSLPDVAEPMRSSIYGGASAFGGLALAAATFACSMTYQSANILLSQARATYSRELRRNWLSIILWMLFAAVLPLLGAGIDGWSSAWGLRLAGFGLAMTCIKAIRATFWLGYTLFMDEIEAGTLPTVEAPPIPERLHR